MHHHTFTMSYWLRHTNQVRKFFEEFGVEDKSIFIVTRVDGKPSGEAFAVFKDEEESRVAMQKLDKKKLGDR
jgi:RNA recognition motif-containing protein